MKLERRDFIIVVHIMRFGDFKGSNVGEVEGWLQKLFI